MKFIITESQAKNVLEQELDFGYEDKNDYIRYVLNLKIFLVPFVNY